MGCLFNRKTIFPLGKIILFSLFFAHPISLTTTWWMYGNLPQGISIIEKGGFKLLRKCAESYFLTRIAIFQFIVFWDTFEKFLPIIMKYVLRLFEITFWLVSVKRALWIWFWLIARLKWLHNAQWSQTCKNLDVS